MSESAPDTPDAYWAAFGYQNHVIPVHDPRRRGTAVIGLCGVMTAPGELGDRDERPTCSVCSSVVRGGSYRLVHRSEAGH
ncbi:hypothetical protein [Haloactinomyces albus]|uniref:Uncharacterized protein n=1 Tax=Haloactinomyces albus TaxID=1352928 RepID=A0AAE3ZAU2_9ACTN|nr:hypothetical protein [Haloactinomyces albus]MDR7301503.1 hypothetical protein [Haloactinomyces albus]